MEEICKSLVQGDHREQTGGEELAAQNQRGSSSRWADPGAESYRCSGRGDIGKVQRHEVQRSGREC